MNETLEDLARKREIVEQDIEALFESLQAEIAAKENTPVFHKVSSYLNQTE